MEKFNLVNVFLLSVPEYILGIYVSFLFISEGNRLPLKDDICDRKKNIFKLAIAVLFMAFFNALLIHYLHDMSVTSSLTLIFFGLTVSVIYKLKWYKGITASLIFGVLLMSIEAIYAPLCVKLFYDDIDAFFNGGGLARILLSMPIRVIQLTIIVSMWNWKITIENLQSYKVSKIWPITLMLLLVGIEANLVYEYLYSFDYLPFAAKISGGIGCLACGLLNNMILLFYVKVVRSVAIHMARR